MHSILRVQERVGIARLDHSIEERSGSFDFEGVSRTELVLVTHKDDLLRIESCKECLIFFNHRSFIHNDSFEAA